MQFSIADTGWRRRPRGLRAPDPGRDAWRPTLFTTAEGIERLWEVPPPLLEAPPPVLPYQPGSWGPVDVTLPEKGKGPFPTIVMLHGFGGSKTDFETTPAGPAPEEAGNGSTIYRYNNVFFAQRGYAVVNYTARGFGALLRRRYRRRPLPAPAPPATSALPTAATRRATPSTCSGCSPTKVWCGRATSASPASPTAAARAWSWPSSATTSAPRKGSCGPGAARR